MKRDLKYGLPTLKKYPMPDAAHVRSAIKFFNYVDSKHEEELANAILARMDEYGMSFDDFGVGDENRFKQYMPKNELKHDCSGLTLSQAVKYKTFQSGREACDAIFA